MLNDLGNALLMRRVGVGVEQADGEALDFLARNFRDQRGDGVLIERRQNLPAPVHALGHRPAQRARHEGREPVGVDVILVETVFVGDLKAVPVAFCNDKRGFRALALDQRVGRQGGAVDDEGDVARSGPGLAQHLADARHEAFGGGGCCRQHLAAGLDAAAFENHVGEGAADIDSKSGAPGVHREVL